MTLSDAHTDQLNTALDRLRAQADIARQQPTLEETRAAVLAVRQTVFALLVMIDIAERETRNTEAFGAQHDVTFHNEQAAA